MVKDATLDFVGFGGRQYVCLEDLVELVRVNTDRYLIRGDIAGADAMRELGDDLACLEPPT